MNEWTKATKEYMPGNISTDDLGNAQTGIDQGAWQGMGRSESDIYGLIGVLKYSAFFVWRTKIIRKLCRVVFLLKQINEMNPVA